MRNRANACLQKETRPNRGLRLRCQANISLFLLLSCSIVVVFFGCKDREFFDFVKGNRKIFPSWTSPVPSLRGTKQSRQSACSLDCFVVPPRKDARRVGLCSFRGSDNRSCPVVGKAQHSPISQSLSSASSHRCCRLGATHTHPGQS